MELLKQIGLGLVERLRINYSFTTTATIGEILRDKTGIKVSTRGNENRPAYCFYFRQNGNSGNNDAIADLSKHLGRQAKIVCIGNSILGILAYGEKFRGVLELNGDEYLFDARMNNERGEDDFTEVSGEAEFSAIIERNDRDNTMRAA